MSTRISGLASGMDIDTLVANLMKTERIPFDKKKQQKQILQWQRDTYKELNSKLLDFRNNKLSAFKMEKTLAAKKATVSGDTTAVTATATGGAANGSYTIKVDTLAVAASKFSGDIRDTANGSSFDPSKTLSSQNENLSGDVGSSSVAIKINGTSVTIDPTTDSLNDVISRINKTTNVIAFYDSAQGKISFTAKNTGATNGTEKNEEYITFEGSFLTDVLQVSATNSTSDSVKGSAAELQINGMSTTRDSNTFTINGTTITLNGKNTAASTVTVGTDADAIVESVKSFISSYNELLSTLTSKITEKRYRDYTPLTDEQKKEMEEDDIKLWEEKAKSGLMKNDTILSELVSNMRMTISSFVETGSSKYKTLSSIGITTGTYSENGKLYLDETKLKEAIEADPEAVAAMFNSKGDASGNNAGIAERLYAQTFKAMGSISEKAGTSKYGDISSLNEDSLMGKQLTQMDKEIDRWTDRLTDRETMYYTKFTAMETAINNYNSQSAYLTNAFSS
ncbi:flagellar filament capping protein FliD [Paenibacillus sp. YN15]|uniref:flagellar filament capping protein FliD n=1 Tax=Paenibacillus sp. YN15 TaxID=1742774 RepID=UPI000DCB6571|nr:flagellar filament capping protein FliD [Paenibacillus sp. YN15]RAV03101.1 flagellar cap protein FliD [Paenibacillus sp. YN15]